jgi:hypothetical protein
MDAGMDTSTDARAVAARLELERALARVERLDPATSGAVRLEALSLHRALRERRLAPASYADQVAALTLRLHDALTLLTTAVPASPAALGRPSR